MNVSRSETAWPASPKLTWCRHRVRAPLDNAGPAEIAGLSAFCSRGQAQGTSRSSRPPFAISDLKSRRCALAQLALSRTSSPVAGFWCVETHQTDCAPLGADRVTVDYCNVRRAQPVLAGLDNFKQRLGWRSCGLRTKLGTQEHKTTATRIERPIAIKARILF